MIQVGDCLDLSELYDENNEWVVQPGRTLSRAGQVYELV